jgi:hypothetical protein
MRLNLSPSTSLSLPLVLVLCVAGLSGCGGKKPTKQEAIAQYGQELHDVVADKVHDAGRRAQMLAIVDRIEALQLQFTRDTEAMVASYRKLDADYGAPRAAFDQMFADYNATRVKARSQVLDLHFQLAALASDDEWRPIAKAETHLYEELSTARPAEAPK